MMIRADDTQALLRRIAGRTGVGSGPVPRTVLEVLPGLIGEVDRALSAVTDLQERRWLATALAALGHQVQLAALPSDVALDDPRLPASHRHPSLGR